MLASMQVSVTVLPTSFASVPGGDLASYAKGVSSHIHRKLSGGRRLARRLIFGGAHTVIH